MKSAILVLLFVLTFLKLVNAKCEWFGTAPWCRGECPAGWKYIDSGTYANHYADGTESPYGFGEECMIGKKVYCCDS
ncbi:hypothetical protein G6F37_007867 [Rhizopus arrhizus]|nr:hypothetical protein G6F38_008050 [Rhizopus arrhizus]KAG1156162.1 hypothetical protein G6F37_007867 [Rhizopus arrhizus]